MPANELEAYRKTASTTHGAISYLDCGEGPAILFVHGVIMNSYRWEKAILALSPTRRCIAVDLPAHGQSIATAEQDFSLNALSDLLAVFCRELGLDKVDLVGNDTGGALCQIFAVRETRLVRTLTLTNCDAHDNLPPAAFSRGKQLAREGRLAPVLAELADNPELSRGDAGLGMGYKHADALPEETIRRFMGPFADIERGRMLERFTNSTSVEDLLAVEPGLERLTTPTLIAWGDADRFFEIDWAYWLHEHIPGARAQPVIEIDGGGLFFPDEHAEQFIPHLERFLNQHSPTAAEVNSSVVPAGG
jgi:pimeloyl-ACP methyl ester carboxylesterase